MTEEEALEFFNRLSGRLRVELTEPATHVSEGLLNVAAPPTARVVSLTIEWSVFEGDDFRAVSENEWSAVALVAPNLQMRGEGDAIVEHVAPDGKAFTVRDLATAVEETERRGRGETAWLGGVDVHHVYFEGVELDGRGVWNIAWGS